MSAKIYVEGGGDSKELQARCREGFRKLLEKSGFKGRMPQFIPCGSRNRCFSDFCTAHRSARIADYTALLVDSEDPLKNPEDPWKHLEDRDKWSRPDGADEDQALLMVTCMETWIVSDRNALAIHYGHPLQGSALPSTVNLEGRDRKDIMNDLIHATRNCRNQYAKGRRSFEILAKLNPTTLNSLLPSFKRFLEILGKKLV